MLEIYMQTGNESTQISELLQKQTIYLNTEDINIKFSEGNTGFFFVMGVCL